MKVFLYSEGKNAFKKSGVGRANIHIEKALKSQNIDYTYNIDDDYDLAHINTALFKSYKVLKKLKKRNIKVVAHAHSTEEDFRNSFVLSNLIAPLFKRIILRVYKNADYLITPSEYSKKLLENYNEINIPIQAVSNGVDTQIYKKDDNLKEEFRKYFNFDSDDKIVLGVGLLFQRKGFIDFIEIARRMPHIKFIWFGELAKILLSKSIKKALKTKPNNLYLPGYQKPDIIKSAYNGCDLFFFPSYEETEGIVVLEALACECKLLIRDIPVYKNWLSNRVNCFKGNNNDEFIRLIDEIVSNKFKEITDFGREIALEKDLTNIGKIYKEIFTNLLND